MQTFDDVNERLELRRLNPYPDRPTDPGTLATTSPSRWWPRNPAVQSIGSPRLDISGQSGILDTPRWRPSALPLYYTPKEVAEMLSISDDAVLDLINRGDLPALRVSPRITRIPIAGFERWREGYVPRRRRVVIRPARREVAVGEGEELPGPRSFARR